MGQWDSSCCSGVCFFYIKKWNRVNKREWGRLLWLEPLLGDVASNYLWHMGKPNLDNLHCHVDWSSVLLDEHGMPHRLCLQIFHTSLFYFLPSGMSSEWLISLGFHFSEEQKDARLGWQLSRNIALIPLQIRPAVARSPQHKERVCLCTLPACSFCTALQHRQDTAFQVWLFGCFCNSSQAFLSSNQPCYRDKLKK